MRKNNKGFTIIEVLFSVVFTAIVMGMIVASQLMMTKETSRMTQDLENSIDTVLAERTILLNLRQVDPSYNNLVQLDDNGLQFFDYYPDVSENQLGNGNSRTLTLQQGGATSVHFLIQDLTAGPLLLYDPVAAFNIGSIPSNLNQAASLSFVSLNKSNWVLGQRPQMWVNDQMIYLDTVSKIRPLVQNNVNMLTPPRSPIFVGRVANQQLVIDQAFASLINYTDPYTGQQITDEDNFLRSVPSSGGGQPIVRMRGVKLVKFFLQPNNGNGQDNKLFRQYYMSNGNYTSTYMVSDHVKRIIFERSTVTQKIVYFKIDRAN